MTKRIMVLAASLLLVACGRNPEAVVDGEPNRNPIQPVKEEKTINFKEGGAVSTAVFRDETGCEWLIFRYRGFGISTQPRTKPYGSDGNVQVCRQ